MVSDQKEIILFVDDEESILDIAREYFQRKGYTVLTASNGREAVRLIYENKIDCCFTDINMPEMDGLELAEYIWQTDKTIPVVIMTGYPSLDNAISTLQKGVVDFLVKPVGLSRMELLLRTGHAGTKTFHREHPAQKGSGGKGTSRGTQSRTGPEGG